MISDYRDELDENALQTANLLIRNFVALNQSERVLILQLLLDAHHNPNQTHAEIDIYDIQKKLANLENLYDDLKEKLTTNAVELAQFFLKFNKTIKELVEGNYLNVSNNGQSNLIDIANNNLTKIPDPKKPNNCLKSIEQIIESLNQILFELKQIQNDNDH